MMLDYVAELTTHGMSRVIVWQKRFRFIPRFLAFFPTISGNFFSKSLKMLSYVSVNPMVDT